MPKQRSAKDLERLANFKNKNGLPALSHRERSANEHIERQREGRRRGRNRNARVNEPSEGLEDPAPEVSAANRERPVDTGIIGEVIFEDPSGFVGEEETPFSDKDRPGQEFLANTPDLPPVWSPITDIGEEIGQFGEPVREDRSAVRALLSALANSSEIAPAWSPITDAGGETGQFGTDQFNTGQFGVLPEWRQTSQPKMANWVSKRTKIPADMPSVAIGVIDIPINSGYGIERVFGEYSGVDWRMRYMNTSGYHCGVPLPLSHFKLRTGEASDALATILDMERRETATGEFEILKWYADESWLRIPESGCLFDDIPGFPILEEYWRKRRALMRALLLNTSDKYWSGLPARLRAKAKINLETGCAILPIALRDLEVPIKCSPRCLTHPFRGRVRLNPCLALMLCRAMLAKDYVLMLALLGVVDEFDKMLEISHLCAAPGGTCIGTYPREHWKRETHLANIIRGHQTSGDQTCVCKDRCWRNTVRTKVAKEDDSGEWAWQDLRHLAC